MRLPTVLVLIMLLVPLLVYAEANGFKAGEIIYGTEAPYMNKRGSTVAIMENGKILVRFEGYTTDVLVTPDAITKVKPADLPSSFSASYGEPVILQTQKVKAIFNEFRDWHETGSCSDGMRNQGETGIDCGGPCRLCQTTPTEEVQRISTLRSEQWDITLDPAGKHIFGADQAEAIPAPSLATGDVTRIAQAVRNSKWVNDVQDDMNIIKSKVESIEAAQGNLKTTADSIKSRVDTVNTNVNGVNTKIDRVEKPLPNLERQLSKLTIKNMENQYLNIANISVLVLALLLVSYLTFALYKLKKELHEVTQTTPDDLHKLTGYFAKMIDKGYDPKVIKKELIKEGFSRASVDMAFENMKKAAK